MRIPALFLALLLPTLARAQTPGVIMNGLTGCNFQTGELAAACIPVFIGHLVELILGLIGSIFVINIMIAGYQYAIGALQGDEGKGKERVMWSIIGLITTLCVYVIFHLVLTVLGI